MNKRTIMATLVVAAVLGTTGAAWAVPQVSNVVMTQRTNSRIVDITYELSGEAAIVTLGIETNGVPIPDSAVTWVYEDVCKLMQTGAHSIVWDAGVDWPEHSVTNAKARVTAWVTNSPPQVMVIDLSKGTSATAENPYPIFYYTSMQAVPKGVTDDLYKTDRLLMRRLAATGPTGFSMGEETKPSECVNVRLTQDFYVGVYEVTQRQWAQVMGTTLSATFNDGSSKWSRPMESVSYHDIRENPSANAPIDPNWPATNTVGESSFMGLLQSKTGLAGFDLPTEAQWEYACRAGTTTYYNDAIDGSSPSQLDDLGWYSGNANGTTHTVGQKTPNAWGLYDMHGNVYEWCLDWYNRSLSEGTNPEGPDLGSSRVDRGGAWWTGASPCRSAGRDRGNPSVRTDGIGFRLVRTLP